MCMFCGGKEGEFSFNGKKLHTYRDPERGRKALMFLMIMFTTGID